MNKVRASTLVDAILEEADMVGSSFVSRATVLRFLNSELSELHDILVASYERYLERSVNINLSAGVETVALPPDFFKSTGVVYNASDGTMYMLKPFTASEIAAVTGPELSVSSINGTNMMYQIIGDTIVFRPSPSGGEEITLMYIPQFAKVASEGDYIDIRIPVGWEDFAIYGAVARCLAKEESDPSFALAMKEKSKSHIVSMAEERDESRSDRVSDVYNWIDRYYGDDY